ncbi:MAG TPA: efflux RND transporter periplasmic adaptor subunit [Bryobacteraceae bacterium]|nr:efflux RND transporter periplasmic adaptor subunit [Bryobacteraceae bacterium]
MRNLNSLALLPVTGIVLLCLLSAGCQRESSAKAAPVPVKVEAAPDPNTVEVDHPEEFPLIKAEARRVHDDLSVTGVVSPDVSLTVPVNSLSGGRVVEIHARLGDLVQKGQLLLRIHSPDLAQAISDYQKAVADEILARRALERANLLFSHGALAEKDKEQAQDTEEKAKVDVRTSSERIRLLGGSVDTLSPIIEVHAPASGTIVAQNITGGAGVKSLDNSPDLFTIADLSRVWILCDVYENNLSQVHLRDFAEVRLNAYPDRKLRGRVSNISSLLDPNTRTAKVRLELANSEGLMRPGMFATAVFVSQDTQTRVFVPAAAILRLHDKDWVFRPVGGKTFRRVEVHAGAARGDGSQEILGGLQPGDQIVANALQFSSTVEQ